jgi:hypothetical protein
MEDRSDLLLGVGLVLRRMRELTDLNDSNPAETAAIHEEAEALQTTWRDLMIKLKGVNPKYLQKSDSPAGPDWPLVGPDVRISRQNP